MLIAGARVAELVPHQGAMCLLDVVVAWDRERIVCHSERHRALDNPLREHGRLSSLHAIEFAAQAMAAHQRLAVETARRARYGLLMSVRQCSFFCDRLDTLASPLMIEATRVAASAEALTYAFDVGCAGEPIAKGRASVLLVSEPSE
jgi:predicted hotdog family 3-hydroxylacyl-ACP dehydratase